MEDRRFHFYLAVGAVMAAITPGWLFTAYQAATPSERLSFWTVERIPAFIPALIGLVFLVGALARTRQRPAINQGPNAGMNRLIRQAAKDARQDARVLRRRALNLANKMLWCDSSSYKRYSGFGLNSALDEPGELPHYTVLKKLREGDEWRWWHVRSRWRRRTRRYTKKMHEEFRQVVEALARHELRDAGLTYKTTRDSLSPKECSEAAATLNYLANRLPDD